MKLNEEQKRNLEVLGYLCISSVIMALLIITCLWLTKNDVSSLNTSSIIVL